MSNIAFRAATSDQGNSTIASVANPAGVAAGDLLLLFLTISDGGTGFTIPSHPTPTGYTLLGSQTTQTSTAGCVGVWYYRWATSSNTAPSITLNPSTQFKWAMALVAYSGGDGTSVPVFTPGTDPQTSSTSHQSETATVSVPTWVVESFGIRTTTNASYTTPSGLTSRVKQFGTGGAAADVAVFDSNADKTGTVGGHTTVSGVASTYGVHATIGIPPGGLAGTTMHAAISLTAAATATATTVVGTKLGWGISYPIATPETYLGRAVDFVREYGWISGRTPTWVNSLASTRRMVISMKWRTASIGVVKATDVTSGLYDTEITAFCTWFNNLAPCPDGPHILDFEHEIDAKTAQSSGTISQLNAAFIHCANIARGLPGWNSWIGPIITGFSATTPDLPLYPSGRAPAFTPLYDISDVVGVDLPYTESYPGSTGDSIVGPAIDYFKTNYPTLPVFIGEWGGSAGTGTQRADWIVAFEAALRKSRYSQVIGVMYWDQGVFALDDAGYKAWAKGGQGPVAATGSLTLTAAANVALKFPVTAAAVLSLAGNANVTSSTGAVRGAAVLTLTAVGTIGTVFASSGTASIDLLAMVNAPVVGDVQATGTVELFGQAVCALTAPVMPVTATALLVLIASGVGPPVTAHVVPVVARTRIVDDGGNFEFDISDLTKSADITIGRTSAIETSIAAATATIIFDDTDGTFDPDNTASPLYGHLEPGPLSGVTLYVDHYASAIGGYVPLFTGSIESLQRTFTGGDYSETTGTFVDSTADLSRHIPAAATVLPAELPGARIARLLTMPSRSGFTWASRSESIVSQLDTGQKMLGVYTCDGSTSSWDIAVGAAQAEGGLLYFDAAGVLIFSGQQDRLNSNVVWSLGDGANQTPVEVDLMYRLSTDDMIVDAAVTSQDGVTRLYGVGGGSTVAADATVTADVTEQSQVGGFNSAASRAENLYRTRSIARRNAPTVTLEVTPVINQWMKGSAKTAYQAACLARISDYVSLTRHPAGGGTTIVSNNWLEGWRMVLDASGSWTVTWNLSRADQLASGYWKLGQSKLASTTNLTW